MLRGLWLNFTATTDIDVDIGLKFNSINEWAFMGWYIMQIFDWI